MELRYYLDPKIYPNLVAKIRKRAGNSSPSPIARIMMAEWSYAEDVLKMTAECHQSVKLTSNDVNSGELNSSSLDTALDNL